MAEKYCRWSGKGKLDKACIEFGKKQKSVMSELAQKVSAMVAETNVYTKSEPGAVDHVVERIRRCLSKGIYESLATGERIERPGRYGSRF